MAYMKLQMPDDFSWAENKVNRKQPSISSDFYEIFEVRVNFYLQFSSKRLPLDLPLTKYIIRLRAKGLGLK